MNFITQKAVDQAITRSEALELLSVWREEEEKNVFSKDSKDSGMVNKENIYQVFEEAEKEIKAMETLVVYVGVEFPDDELKNLGRRMKKLIKALLEFKYDPTMVGGARLIWKGQEKNYSLRAILDENKNAIRDLIRAQI